MEKLRVSEIKTIFNLIIEKLEFYEVDSIDIDTDLYRLIPTNIWDSFDKEDVHIGSLIDDVTQLKLLVSEEERPCTFVDFDRLASVLRFLSEKLNPSGDI